MFLAKNLPDTLLLALIFEELLHILDICLAPRGLVLLRDALLLRPWLHGSHFSGFLFEMRNNKFPTCNLLPTFFNTTFMLSNTGAL